MTHGRCNAPAAAVRPPGRVTDPTWWGGWGHYYPTLPGRYRRATVRMRAKQALGNLRKTRVWLCADQETRWGAGVDPLPIFA
jgi:hypothetical protein